MRLIIISLVVVFFSSSTLTAPVANLKISGDIKPPTCTVNGGTESGDINFNFPKISPGVLNEKEKIPLNLAASLSQPLVVMCDAETYLTFIPTDSYTVNHTTSYNIKETLFGLVDTVTGKEIGAITFYAGDNKVDGEEVYVSSSLRTGYERGRTLTKNSVMGWTSKQQQGIPPSELALVSGKQFETRLYVYQHAYSSYIRPTEDLVNDGVDISDGLNYIGQAVLNFNFGI